jgi:hypothetical protein
MWGPVSVRHRVSSRTTCALGGRSLRIQSIQLRLRVRHGATWRSVQQLQASMSSSFAQIIFCTGVELKRALLARVVQTGGTLSITSSNRWIKQPLLSILPARVLNNALRHCGWHCASEHSTDEHLNDVILVLVPRTQGPTGTSPLAKV